MFFRNSLFLDPGNERTVGGGSATPVAQDWSQFLLDGLNTGSYGGDTYQGSKEYNDMRRKAATDMKNAMKNPASFERWMQAHQDTVKLATGKTPTNIPGTTTPWVDPRVNTGGNPTGQIGAPAIDPAQGHHQATQGIAGV